MVRVCVDPKFWDEIYFENAHEELGWYEPSPTKSSEIVVSLGVGRDAVVADVGCGQSFFVDDLIRLGFRNIVAIDWSEVALSKLRARLGVLAQHVMFVRADLTSPDFPVIRVDVWHDRAVLHFITEEEKRKQYLGNLKKCLRVGGYAVFAEHSHAGPERCSGLALRRYEPEELAEFLGEGFALIGHFKHDHVAPSGSRRNMTYAVFKRVG